MSPLPVLGKQALQSCPSWNPLGWNFSVCQGRYLGLSIKVGPLGCGLSLRVMGEDVGSRACLPSSLQGAQFPRHAKCLELVVWPSPSRATGKLAAEALRAKDRDHLPSSRSMCLPALKGTALDCCLSTCPGLTPAPKGTDEGSPRPCCPPTSHQRSTDLGQPSHGPARHCCSHMQLQDSPHRPATLHCDVRQVPRLFPQGHE